MDDKCPGLCIKDDVDANCNAEPLKNKIHGHPINLTSNYSDFVMTRFQ